MPPPSGQFLILINFLAFLPCVCPPPAAAVGPTALIFWYEDRAGVWFDSLSTAKPGR